MNMNIRGLLQQLAQIVLPIVLIFGALIWFNNEKLNTRLHKWKSAAAVVTSIEAVGTKEKNDLFTRINYKYEVSGEKFTDTESFSYRTYPTIAKDFQKGMRLNVLYDPEHPNKSAMREGIERDAGMTKSLIPVVTQSLIGLAIAMSLLWIRVHKDGWFPGKVENGLSPLRR